MRIWIQFRIQLINCIRIRIFYLMRMRIRMRIQVTKMMRIRIRKTAYGICFHTLSLFKAEMELGKSAAASPATISVTSLIKEAESAGIMATAAANHVPAAAGRLPTAANGHLNSGGGGVPNKQFIADDYMARVLGGGRDDKVAANGGRQRVLGGRAVRQVLSNNV
jgi:hypothetical protein